MKLQLVLGGRIYKGGLRGSSPLLPKTPWSLPSIAPPKILETIDEERQGIKKKKGHQAPLPSIPGFAITGSSCAQLFLLPDKQTTK